MREDIIEATSAGLDHREEDEPYGTPENVTPHPAEPLTYNPIFHPETGVMTLSEQLWQSGWVCVCLCVCSVCSGI